MSPRCSWRPRRWRMRREAVARTAATDWCSTAVPWDRPARPAGRVRSRAHVAGTKVKILVPGNHLMAGLLGQRDELLRVIEGVFGDVRIAVRGNEISIEGEGAERVGALFEELIILLESGQGLDALQVNRTIDMMHDDVRPSEVLTEELLRSSRGRAVRPKTAGQ